MKQEFITKEEKGRVLKLISNAVNNAILQHEVDSLKTMFYKYGERFPITKLELSDDLKYMKIDLEK